MPDGGERPYRIGKSASAIGTLEQKLGTMAEVRAPGAAEEPILHPSVRAAIYLWLSEIRAASELEEVGLRPRSTAILYGPPGTGKTTLAHHLSARLGIPLVVVGSENLIGKYLGDSQRNVAGLFDALKAAETPCILFLDELDAVGMKRDSVGSNSSAGAELIAMLTVLLRKIEEYRGFCIGATNRQEALDPALWRRFHMQISVDLPTEDERFAIIRRYSAPYELRDEDVELLTDLTSGASPALLRGMMEGMKRALIVHPKVGLKIDDPVKLFVPIITSLQPPPGITKPPLWANETAIYALSSMATAWPPTRKEAE